MKNYLYKPYSFLPFSEIFRIFQKNREFLSNFKKIYDELEKTFSDYYNLNSRHKLNNITNIISQSQNLFVESNNNKSKNDLEKLTFLLAYGKIMNNILKHNKILIFKYEITQETNYNQILAILNSLTYPKGVMLTIQNECNEQKFVSFLNCILYLENIVDFTVNIGSNYFGFARNAKKMSLSIKEKETDLFFTYKYLFYTAFSTLIDFFWLNFEDFGSVTNKVYPDNIYTFNKVELNLSFSKNKENEFINCLNHLSRRLKTNSLKILLFTQNNFSYVTEFISKIKPDDLWVIPYKDVPSEFCDNFLQKINTSCSLTKLNIINIIYFSKNTVHNFLEKQTLLEDLRITGNISEEIMEEILRCYLNKSKKYSIKKISLNGKIIMNEKWKNLICDFMKLENIEAFHIDVFFNGKEYMRDIANAFYLNKSMTSFTVRNSVRHERDVFVDVLKEMLYEYNIPRKEVFTKIRMYKLL